MPTYPELSPKPGDSDNVLLRKLVDLILKAGTAPVVPHDDVHIVGSVPIEVTDGGGSLTVDGTVNVGNLPAVQPVSDNGGSLTVDGTVSVGNFPAVQPVSDNGGSLTVDGTVGITNATFQNGHMSTVETPLEFEVAHTGAYLHGGVEKTSYIYRVIGRRAGFNSTSVLQDAGEWLSTSINLFPVLAGTENLELVSSSAQDDPNPVGTGTHSVRITYIKTDYTLGTVDYNLNGTAPVAVAEKMLFVLGMEALTGGTAEISAGNIDLRNSAGGEIHERITAGGNRSLSGRFMVPDGYTAYILGWSVGAVGTTMDCRLRATTRTLDNALNDRYLFKSAMFLGAGTNAVYPLVYRKLPARAKVKVSVLPGAAAAANRIDCEIVFLLVQD